LTETKMSPGDLALVTGASGFVGSAVARRLADRGLRVRVLVRPTSDKRNIEGAPFEVALGDMTDEDSVSHAMRGARFVFHVAADYRLWARDPSEIMRANVVGTRMVMEGARRAGVERIVHTSSVATLDVERDAVDETHPLPDGGGVGIYKQSKVASERLVERMAADVLPVVIVMPSTPIGPRDVKPTPTGRILVEAASGKIPAFVDTGLNLVHVDDVAEGHLLAMERGRTGERYILGGQDASLREMLTAIAELTGRRPPTVNVPRASLYPLAWAAETLARFTGREPFVTRDALDMAAHRMFFSSAKAERELGYSARPYRAALADALAWFRSAGYIR
jgi:dihydroflavonol-4-reductase